MPTILASRKTDMAGPTPFKSDLIRIARQENQTLGSLHRGDPELEKRIEAYCRDVDVSATSSVRAHYSAVFISWCMRAAGASKEEFPATAAHWEYAGLALRNVENGEGLFRARTIESYAPKPGDVIHVNRTDGKVSYDQIGDGHYRAESGIVVEVGDEKVLMVMGNQEPLGNVGIEKASLDGSGLLVQRAKDPFICVIEVLK
jgi:hypothetical protein